MSEENRGNNFFSGLILGAIIGAGVYYFLTSTKEGKEIKTELKKRIKEKGEKALDNLNDLVMEIEEKGEEFKQKAKQIQAQLEEKAKSVQNQAATEAEEQLVRISELRERGRKAVNFFTRNGKPLS